jgi:transcriptional regulator with XRE-family HTH domain
MRDVAIDGAKLRELMRLTGTTQVAAGDAIGVGKCTVCRWCTSGEKNIRRENAVALAGVLGMTTDQFIAAVAPGAGMPAPGLTRAEAELVDLYRSLSLRGQQKALRALEEAIQSGP